MSEELYYRPTTKGRRPLLAALALAAVAAFAGPATDTWAATSPIGSSIGSEPSHEQILENLFGGSFARSGDDFTNGQVDVQRLGDDGAGAEQIFQPEFVSARAVASFARNSQTFGTIDESGRFQALLSTHRNAAESAGPVDLRGAGLSNTILALQSGGSTFSSDPALNPRGADQLVSYSVKSRSSANASASPDSFLLFWEDTASSSSDYDYNDLVVQVNAADPGSANVLIPLPAAAYSGLIVLGGVGVAAGIRRIRRK